DNNRSAHGMSVAGPHSRTYAAYHKRNPSQGYGVCTLHWIELLLGQEVRHVVCHLWQCRSYTMYNKYSCLEMTPCSSNPVLEGDALMADTINTVIGDIAVNKNLVDSLPGDLSFPESALDVTITGLNEQNKDFSKEEPSTGL
ncbi:hypothetical protein A6R68_02351, partial [Neotoma lepida]